MSKIIIKFWPAAEGKDSHIALFVPELGDDGYISWRKDPQDGGGRLFSAQEDQQALGEPSQEHILHYWDIDRLVGIISLLRMSPEKLPKTLSAATLILILAKWSHAESHLPLEKILGQQGLDSYPTSILDGFFTAMPDERSAAFTHFSDKDKFLTCIQQLNETLHKQATPQIAFELLTHVSQQSGYVWNPFKRVFSRGYWSTTRKRHTHFSTRLADTFRVFAGGDWFKEHDRQLGLLDYILPLRPFTFLVKAACGTNLLNPIAFIALIMAGLAHLVQYIIATVFTVVALPFVWVVHVGCLIAGWWSTDRGQSTTENQRLSRLRYFSSHRQLKQHQDILVKLQCLEKNLSTCESRTPLSDQKKAHIKQLFDDCFKLSNILMNKHLATRSYNNSQWRCFSHLADFCSQEKKARAFKIDRPPAPAARDPQDLADQHRPVPAVSAPQSRKRKECVTSSEPRKKQRHSAPPTSQPAPSLPASQHAKTHSMPKKLVRPKPKKTNKPDQNLEVPHEFVPLKMPNPTTNQSFFSDVLPDSVRLPSAPRSTKTLFSVETESRKKQRHSTPLTSQHAPSLPASQHAKTHAIPKKSVLPKAKETNKPDQHLEVPHEFVPLKMPNPTTNQSFVSDVLPDSVRLQSVPRSTKALFSVETESRKKQRHSTPLTSQPAPSLPASQHAKTHSMPKKPVRPKPKKTNKPDQNLEVQHESAPLKMPNPTTNPSFSPYVLTDAQKQALDEQLRIGAEKRMEESKLIFFIYKQKTGIVHIKGDETIKDEKGHYKTRTDYLFARVKYDDFLKEIVPKLDFLTEINLPRDRCTSHIFFKEKNYANFTNLVEEHSTFCLCEGSFDDQPSMPGLNINSKKPMYNTF